MTRLASPGSACPAPKAGRYLPAASGWVNPSPGTFFRQLSGTPQDHIEHRRSEPARERVLLTGVIAAQQHVAPGRVCLRAVAETLLASRVTGQKARDAMGPVPGEGAETENNANIRQGTQFVGEVGQTIVTFLRGRPVDRRGTADAGTDVAVDQAEAIIAVCRGRLAREAGAVQSGIEEIAGTVAGEDATSAVAAVGRRRQTADKHAGRWITKAGHGASPVFLIAESSPLLARRLLAPLHQPRAARTGDDALTKLIEAGKFHEE